MAFDSGATPIVVLTKADGTDISNRSWPKPKRQSRRRRDDHEFGERSGIERLRSILHEGVTAVMLGASGAGKTSLLNALEDQRS